MHKLEDLKIWNKAMDVAEMTYLITENFPQDERFGMTSQIRRSAVSIPSNIAEGAGRNTNGEFRHFLGIANGSSYELYTQLILAQRLKIINKSVVEPVISKVIEIQKMGYSLINSFKK